MRKASPSQDLTLSLSLIDMEVGKTNMATITIKMVSLMKNLKMLNWLLPKLVRFPIKMRKMNIRRCISLIITRRMKRMTKQMLDSTKKPVKILKNCNIILVLKSSESSSQTLLIEFLSEICTIYIRKKSMASSVSFSMNKKEKEMAMDILLLKMPMLLSKLSDLKEKGLQRDKFTSKFLISKNLS